MDNVLIILTSTVHVNRYKSYIYQTDSKERVDTYVKSVKEWLEKTSFRICLVENSDYTYPELNEYSEKYKDRFEIITFDEFKLPPDLQHIVYNTSKGASEMLSIILAYNNAKFKDGINFIIKVTARYFIPELEPFLLEHNIKERTRHIGILDDEPKIIGLRQSNENRCEVIGIHKRFFDILFELKMSDDNGYFYSHVETIYRNRLRLFNQEKILVCPLFKIEPTQMGGLDLIVEEI